MAEKMWRISICMIMAFLLCACAGNTNMEKKVRDLGLPLSAQQDISEELKKHIDERKEEASHCLQRWGGDVSDCRLWQTVRRRFQYSCQ